MNFESFGVLGDVGLALQAALIDDESWCSSWIRDFRKEFHENQNAAVNRAVSEVEEEPTVFEVKNCRLLVAHIDEHLLDGAGEGALSAP